MDKHVELKLCAAALVVSAVVFGYFASVGWPGSIHECVATATCYCEARCAEAIAQPVNTWSSLAFAMVGLAVAAHSGRRRAAAVLAPISLGRWALHSTLLCVAVCLLAPGAIFFHASLTDWGGILDVASMYLFLGLWMASNLQLVFAWSDRAFVAFYGASVAVLTAPRFFGPSYGVPLFIAVIAATLITEWLPTRVTSRPESVRGSRRWLWRRPPAVQSVAALGWKQRALGVAPCFGRHGGEACGAHARGSSEGSTDRR